MLSKHWMHNYPTLLHPTRCPYLLTAYLRQTCTAASRESHCWHPCCINRPAAAEVLQGQRLQRRHQWQGRAAAASAAAFQRCTALGSIRAGGVAWLPRYRLALPLGLARMQAHGQPGSRCCGCRLPLLCASRLLRYQGNVLQLDH